MLTLSPDHATFLRHRGPKDLIQKANPSQFRSGGSGFYNKFNRVWNNYLMRAFIVESGAMKIKTGEGVSHLFTIMLVLFEDHNGAKSCDFNAIH